MIYPQNFEEKLGFDQIRKLLAQKCLSTLGEERIENMTFSTDYKQISFLLKQVTEFVNLIQSEEAFPHQNFYDVRSALKRVRIEGLYIEEKELYELKRVLETIKDIVHFLRPKEDEPALYPHLYTLCDEIEYFPFLIKKIDSIVDKYGKIKDNASPALSQIRRELATTTGSISQNLHRILRTAQSEGLVDKDATPTIRGGRLVIPIAPGLKRKIKGIIHDESATGKTVFIEPSEVVEANNRIRELEAEERREIIKILTDCSAEIRPNIEGILQSLSFLAEIDFIRAKALLSIEMKATMPTLEDRTIIEWHEAIHPLLRMSLEKNGRSIVPLDIHLNATQRILLISGPNAGGKSVCLKTVGLLQYMLQSGLLIPLHEQSKAGIFQDIFIDIGDEQSIEDDLSTYSSHLLNMKQTLRYANERSMILIDEFGSGTEPQIGGAIAESILKRFNERGVWGIITTHYQNLKHYADEQEGIINGAMLYDRHEMRALFRLQIGNPGSSFAVEIARKIGLPEEIIADASEIVGQNYIQSDKYLQDIVRDKKYWENKRQSIRQKEKRMEETIAEYELKLSALKEEKKTILKETQEKATSLLKEANAKIENTIRGIKEAQAEREKTKELRQSLASFQQEMLLGEEKKKEKHQRELEKILERKAKKKEKKNQQVVPATRIVETPPIAVGGFVRIKGQNTTGKVLELGQKKAIVAFGEMKTSVNLDRLEHAEAPKEEKFAKAATFISVETHNQMYDKKLNFKQDIDVRGMRGDEAIRAITYFIDDALLIGVKRVRILHGTGTGILRTLIRQYLSTVSGVSHYEDEHVQFGGAGITVVDL
ncbi:MAG: Smr/MutS family protein [Phocaeicola sp.]|nr:Smr/MutS family protein [Phocaeicola sp.]MDD7449345.1 Smr/MutS family protein [Prevotellaceae bacterium]MDY5938556.1 Smr/MutS family protein [Phocaeicola sp.]